jgi:hypothetical protein
VPTLSSFYGIIIRMYYDDHAPPHFHAHYGEASALIAIETLEVLDGSLPRRALSLTLEWASQHREELRSAWKLAEEHHPLGRIAPLE